ncbi:metal-dependent hydrolase (plasmid) [Halostagnicola larsenii XH-48]|uniref:Metal-dependent hydrolase n=1 Tax=Halostagnicola larsenii XH-48 TaxID=797299 RepID=W0JW58_9EURY|nr:metal-dependent hydrolase [Halostagnicola larsenii]AHG01495.1 metal-dependent hydrolase [Halostagnicola larsenii XH-48]
MEGERVVFLSIAFATHALVGYALVRGFTDADARIGLVFGLVPDGDFLFPATWGWPFVHRGLTHTPVFALTIVIVVYALRRDRSITLAVALAIGSHLAIDSLSSKGIDWVFPLAETAGPGLSVHGPVATIVLWTASIGLLVVRTDVLERSSERSDPEPRY